MLSSVPSPTFVGMSPIIKRSRCFIPNPSAPRRQQPTSAEAQVTAHHYDWSPPLKVLGEGGPEPAPEVCRL